MPGDAAERGRLADRAAGVGAGGAQAQPGRHRRGRAARAAARHEVAIVARPGPGIAHPAVVGGHVRRAHRELVEIGLAQADRARFPQFAADRRFIGRHEAVQDVRAGGGQHALGAEQILDRRAACLRAGRPRRGRAARRRPRPSPAPCSGVSVMKALRPRWRSTAATCARVSSGAEKLRARAGRRAPPSGSGR